MRDLRISRLPVNVPHPKLFLGFVDARLGDGHRLALLVNLEVIASNHARTYAGEAVVIAAAFHRWTADDQRRPSLIDQDVVNFVDDGEMSISLVPFVQCERNVPAQVVETKLVVRPVHDVAAVDIRSGLGCLEMAVRIQCKLAGRILTVFRIVSRGV